MCHRNEMYWETYMSDHNNTHFFAEVVQRRNGIDIT